MKKLITLIILPFLVTNTYSVCFKHCRECDGPGRNQCRNCHSSTGMHFDNNYCICGWGKYVSGDICKSCTCHHTTPHCSGSATNCHNCGNNAFVLANGSCSATCSIPGKYIGGDNECYTNCSSPCSTCQAGSTTLCATCETGYFLEGNVCTATCLAPKWKKESTPTFECVSTCPTPFKKKEDTKECLQNCPSGYLLKIDTSECTQDCPSGYYQNAVACFNCPDTCETCNSLGCLTCPTGKVLHLTNCLDNCPQGFYLPSGSQECSSCQSQCLECSTGSGATHCTTCKSGKVKNKETGTPTGSYECLAQCPLGKFLESGECQSCHSDCKSCEGSALNCTSCSPTHPSSKIYFHRNSCLSVCPVDFYEDSNKCTPCQSPCKDCGSKFNCKTCVPGFSFDAQSKKCSSSCPIGQFKITSGGNCLPCNTSCLSCAVLESDCTSCSGKLLENKRCVDNCSDGFFQSGANCLPCDSGCLTCAENSSKCLSCKNTGKTLENNQCKTACSTKKFIKEIQNSQKLCQDCDSSCQECTENTSTSCTKCDGTKLSSGSCLTACPSKTYEDNSHPSDPVCLDCDSRCKKCSGAGPQRCETCHQEGTHPILFNMECLATCPSKFYEKEVLSKLICEPCVSPCFDCFDNLLCKSCTDGFLYNEIKKGCYKTCPKGEAWNWTSKECQPCQENCLDRDLEKKECTECQQGYFVNPSNRLNCKKIIKTIKLKNKYFDKKEGIAYFIFDHVLQQKDFNLLLQVTLVDSNSFSLENQDKLTYTISRTEGKDGLKITLKVDLPIEKGVLKIFNIASGVIQSKATSNNNNNEKRNLSNDSQIATFQEESLSLDSINYYNPSGVQQTIKNMKKGTQASIQAITTATMIISAPFGLLLLKLLQIFDFLRFINIDLPLNFQTFLDFFDSNILDLIPNPIPKMDEEGLCNLHPKIKQNDMECLLINNGGGLIFQILSYLALKAILLAIRKKLRSNQKTDDSKTIGKKDKKSTMLKFFLKVDNTISFSFFCNLLMAMHMDMMVAVFINLRSFFVYPFSIFINSVLSGIFAIAYFKYGLVCLSKAKLYNRYEQVKTEQYGKNRDGEDQEKEDFKNIESWAFLKEDLKGDTQGTARFINQIQFMRDYILCFFIIMFIDSPLIQIIPSLLLFCITSFIVVKYHPFKTKSKIILVSINEISYVIILLIFLCIQLFGGILTEEKRYLIFGYPLIGLVSLTIIGNIAVCLTEACRGLINIIKKWKGKKKKQIRTTKKSSKQKKKREIPDQSESWVNLQGDLSPEENGKGNSILKHGDKQTNVEKNKINYKPKKRRAKRSLTFKVKTPAIRPKRRRKRRKKQMKQIHKF